MESLLISRSLGYYYYHFFSILRTSIISALRKSYPISNTYFIPKFWIISYHRIVFPAQLPTWFISHATNPLSLVSLSSFIRPQAMNFIPPFIKFQWNVLRNYTRRVDMRKAKGNPLKATSGIIENIVHQKKAMRRLRMFKEQFDNYIKTREMINQFPPAPYCPD